MNMQRIRIVAFRNSSSNNRTCFVLSNQTRCN